MEEKKLGFRVLPVLKGKKDDLLKATQKTTFQYFATKTKYAVCFNDLVEYFVSLGNSGEYHYKLLKAIAEEFITNLSNRLGEEQGGVIEFGNVNIFYFYLENDIGVRNENDPENVPLVFLELEAYLEAFWQFVETNIIKLKSIDVSETNAKQIAQTVEVIKNRFNEVESKLKATFIPMN